MKNQLQIIENKKTGNRIFTVLIIISLVCASFKNVIPGLDLGDIVLLTAMGWLMLNYNIMEFELEFSSVGIQLLMLYMVYMALTVINGLLLVHFSLYEVLIRLIRWLFYILVILFGAPFFDYQYGRKIIKRISVIAALIIIVQRIYILITGKALSVTLLGTEIGNSVEYIRVNGSLTVINRPSAFFSEPAHLTFFTVLGLIFILEEISEKRNSLKAASISVMISSALLISTSTYAYFLLVLVWGWFLIFKWKRSAWSLILILFAALILLLSIPWMDWNSNLDILYLVKKVTSIGQTSRTTYFSRYSDMLTGIHQWIGIGVGNEEYYLLSRFGFDSGYVNSVTMTYLYAGWIGLILWGWFWITVFCSIGTKQWLPGCIAVALALCSTDFYGKFSVLYFIIMSAGKISSINNSKEWFHEISK